ncbi:MAG TPA: hypothetical protein PKA14_22770, partial [Leptospiraceae bacterium]|nr:hypothetical protein [Leptospiraceae bacterium]
VKKYIVGKFIEKSLKSGVCEPLAKFRKRAAKLRTVSKRNNLLQSNRMLLIHPLSTALFHPSHLISLIMKIRTQKMSP